MKIVFYWYTKNNIWGQIVQLEDDIVNLTTTAPATATAMLDLNATSRYFELFWPSTKLPLNLTHWLPELFANKAFLGHFGSFLGWISAKLALMCSTMHLHRESLAFLALASRFMTFWHGQAQKSKFWDSFWARKWLASQGFSIFGIFFFTFPFSPLLSFSLQWLTF